MSTKYTDTRQSQEETIAVFMSNSIKCSNLNIWKRPLQCSYETHYQAMKWVLKLSIPSSIISGSNWENLKHIELQPNLPVCL